MLDTAFARPFGDAGNSDSWPFPVLIERVSGAYARPVVDGTHRDINAFVEAGRLLCEQGACAVITTCGFLIRYQDVISAALPAPVLTSTLTQYKRLARALPKGKRLAILTICRAALDEDTLSSAGIEPDALVFGLSPDAHFVRAILDGTPPLDVQRATSEWETLARECLQKHTEIGGWLFECANMPPYSKAIASATGMAVYDAITLGTELHAGQARIARQST